MSDAPERIFMPAFWEVLDGIIPVDQRAEDDDLEYVRADLPATDAQALVNDKLRGLVEVLRECVDDLDRALRDGYEGVWSESDFEEHLAPYRAFLRDLEAQ